MIVLKNLEIEESLIKPSVTLRKDHECAFCGEVIKAGKKAIQASFRYDGKLYPLYFHSYVGVIVCFCFSKFTLNNVKSLANDKNRNNPTT